MKIERTIVIVKDVVLFTVGLAGIVYQQLTGDVNEALLLVFTVMVGLPGALALWTLKNSSSTALSSSSSPSPPQPSDSPSSSPHV